MQIKVVSLNIWDGGRIFENLVDFLKTEAADIYLLQEVYHNDGPELEPRFRAYKELQQRLGILHSFYAPAYLEVIDQMRYQQGNAVLSKFPLKQVGVQFYGRPFGTSDGKDRSLYPNIPRNLQHVIADTGEKPLHVFNTQGIWGENGRDNPDRLRMSEKIVTELQNVPEHEPVLLAGDTNTEPNTETIRMIESHLFRLFQNELQTSFNVKRKDLEKYPGYATSVVDMMFVSHDVKVLEQDCPQVDVSDHLPLVATIEI